MTALRPVDVPELRLQVMQEISTWGVDIYTAAINAGSQIGADLIPGSPATKARQLVTAELDRLARAQLYYVSPDMTGLAVTAGATLPEFSLVPQDLPSPAGFMVFAEPIGSARDEPGMPTGGEAPIVACSWNLLQLPVVGYQDRQPFVWFTWYSDRDRYHDLCLSRGLMSAAEVEQRRRAYPCPLSLDNETLASAHGHSTTNAMTRVVSQPDGTYAQEACTLAEDGTHRWAMVVKSAWLLMDQRIAEAEEVVWSRTDAKRVRRRTGEEPPTVRVVLLRRRERHADGGEDEGGRHYTHQWVVRGHWRNQWHPSRGEHRPRWITPHLKGPAGAPLLGGERVHAWTR